MKFYTKDNIVMYQGEVISLDVIGEVYDGLTEEEKRRSRKYHLYSDYEDGDYLNDDIDKKILNLYKLI